MAGGTSWTPDSILDIPDQNRSLANRLLDSLPTEQPLEGGWWNNSGTAQKAGPTLPTITLQPQSQSVAVGEAAAFTVAADGATSYQWRRDGEPISGATSTTYEIASAVEGDDAVAFDCVVTGPGGSVVSDAATLTVTLPQISGMTIVSFGESNSGGQVANSNATSWELESRPELQILNLNTQLWESLDIGTNNNLDHTGLTPALHAWEIGLANRARTGFFGDQDVALVQTGHGGSKLSDWNAGGSYWSKFLDRTNRAMYLGTDPAKTAVWISFGINDSIAGTSGFQAGFTELIGRIKTQLPGCRIYISKLMTNTSQKITYNTTIDSIASADAAIEAIDITGLTTQDSHHWDYASQKNIARRICRSMAADFTGLGQIEWTGFTGNNGEYFSASGTTNIAISTEPIDTSQPFAVVAGVPSNNGTVTTLSTDNVSRSWNITTNRICNWYLSSGSLYIFASTVVASGLPATTITRAKKSGNDILLQTSEDGGGTWTTRHTYTDALSGITEAWVKVQAAVSTPSSSLDVSLDLRTA